MNSNIRSIILLVGLIMAVFVGIGLIIAYDATDSQQAIADNFTYNRAIIKLVDGTVVDTELKSWKLYSDDERILIVAKDGNIYLTSPLRCDIINDEATALSE